MEQALEQSPFIGNTNIQWAWDATSIGYLKTCPRLYQYTMIEGWRSETEHIALRFGSELHESFQQYHIERAADRDHETALTNVIAALMYRIWDWKYDEDTKAAKYRNKQSLVRTIILYLDQYENDNAVTFIKDDGSPAVELSFRFELDFGPNTSDEHPYTLCGHLDRIVNFTGDLYVMDYKTTTTTPGNYYFNQWEPENQMSLYSLASQVIMDSPVKGVMIDAIQMLLEPPYFRSVRGMTYRTEPQQEEWLQDLAYWFAVAETYAENNYWPQNDTACNKYGGCRFREVCSKSPQVREQFLKAKFTKEEPWNPLITR